MTDVLIKEGARDWVNHANEMFNSQLISDTGAIYSSVQGMNGFHGDNMIYRVVTFPSGLKQVYFAGWDTGIRNVPKNSTVQAYKLPINWGTKGYYVNVSQVTNGDSLYRHRVQLDPNTGIVSFFNPYDFDVSDFSAGISLVLTQVGV